MGSSRENMAALIRPSLGFSRSFSTTAPTLMSGAGHAGGGFGVWKKAFFLGAIPCVILANVNAFVLADHEERPEFVAYDIFVRGQRDSPGAMVTTLSFTTIM